MFKALEGEDAMLSFYKLSIVILLFFLAPTTYAILDVDVVAHWRVANSGEKFHGVTLGGYSGLFYLEGADKLVAIQDRPAENKLGPSYMTVFGITREKGKLQQLGISPVGILELGGMPGTFDWATFCDLEAIVRTPDGQWLVASEGGYLNTHAEILRYDEKLKFVDKLPWVDFYRPLLNKGVRKNQSIESLAVAPTGQWLFTANEMPLQQDLQKGNQTWVRLVRFRRNNNGNYNPIDWVYYQMQPEPDNGVVEMVAYGEHELLTLERSYNPKTNKVTARIYQVVYPPVGAVMAEEVGTVLYKRLVVDFDDLRFQLPPEYKNLDNFEGMALGAEAGGKRELFVVSDDNFSKLQQTIILGLKIPWPLPEDLANPMNTLKSKQGMGR